MDGAWKKGFCERGREKAGIYWRKLLGENKLEMFGGRKRVENAGWDLRRGVENKKERKKAGNRWFLVGDGSGAMDVSGNVMGLYVPVCRDICHGVR